MREQAIVQKVGNRSGMSSGRRSAGTAQRPSRRERGQGRDRLARRLRGALRYFPVVLKLLVAISIGLLLFAGYRAAASASFFQISNVEVQGASRASTENVQSLIRREVSKTGVWKAELPELSNKLEHVPWIRSAVVSRVLPDGIRVRIVERVPRAVVRTSAGRFRWVDEDAVLLGEMNPTDQMPAFFLRGLSEDESESARKENIERVRRFLELQRECDVAGISERISEINLLDLRDLRAQLAGNDSQIEVRLGSQEAGKRLKHGLEILDTQRQTPRGQFISYVDLSQGKRAVIGFTSGAHVSAVSSEGAEKSDRSESTDPGGPARHSENRAGRKEKSRQNPARRREQ
ncbi:MAG: cell division protein FtsQ/DivIB [Pyrinomonadaceae bacterium]